MNPRFLQLHLLTSYPASLLNRDDAGFAKRIPFGGSTRTRISSQCLKRHWRTHQGEHQLSDIGELAIRSRLSFERFVVEPLVSEGVPRPLAVAITEQVMDGVLGKSAKAKLKKKDEEEAVLGTGQITVLGKPELDYLLSLARSIAEEISDPSKTKEISDAVKAKLKSREMAQNLQALGKAAGLDAALFGRMVTSDILARGDAAIHVAHAFTVHREAAESDYFTAVDDLLVDDDALGSGHLGNTELTSGLFYSYLAVDVPLLVSNLSGCDRKKWREERDGRVSAAKVISWLVQAAATVSPGAKLGSTAPYAYSHLVLAEAGDAQPRTLANAFLEPVSDRGNLIRNAYEALKTHVDDLDRMYGKTSKRNGAAMGPTEALEGLILPDSSLAGVAQWASKLVEGAL